METSRRDTRSLSRSRPAFEGLPDEDRSVFSVHADKAHFKYWSRLAFPTIGVVVDPDDLTACWMDLTPHLTPERIENGPYSVHVHRSPQSVLTPAALNGAIGDLVRTYARERGEALPAQESASTPSPGGAQKPENDCSGSGLHGTNSATPSQGAQSYRGLYRLGGAYPGTSQLCLPSSFERSTLLRSACRMRI